MTSLRDRLRTDTAPRHERVDHAYSSLDLTQSDGLRTFLGSQFSVLAAVRCGPGRHAAEAADLGRRMASALRSDLRDLRAGPALPVAERRLDATAVLYMLLGSSLGTRVLRRRWLEATDPSVATAGRFLGLAPPPGAWRTLCEELEQSPAQGAEADRIVHDVEELFELHLTVLARHSRLPEGAPHA